MRFKLPIRSARLQSGRIIGKFVLTELSSVSSSRQISFGQRRLSGRDDLPGKQFLEIAEVQLARWFVREAACKSESACFFFRKVSLFQGGLKFKRIAEFKAIHLRSNGQPEETLFSNQQSPKQPGRGSVLHEFNLLHWEEIR